MWEETRSPAHDGPRAAAEERARRGYRAAPQVHPLPRGAGVAGFVRLRFPNKAAP